MSAVLSPDTPSIALSLRNVSKSYGGVQALLTHRVAHAMHEAGIPLVPHVIANTSKMVTGVEIHPGAVIPHQCGVDAA